MVAVVPKTETNNEIPHQTACDWRVLGRFDTLEPAEAALARLRDRGVDAHLQMVDGLTIIGPRRSL